jgi:hypothetical protein
MTQNTSSAVMQQRSEPHDSLDDFPTPPWATRALIEWIEGQGEEHLACMSVREPCANRGYMVRPLSEAFGAVLASDVHDYGLGYRQEDYLFGLPANWAETDLTVMNPPFRLAEQFVERALQLTQRMVAVFVRSAFLEGEKRHRQLFLKTPPTDILQFAERVPLVKGRYDPEASTATSYCWLVWRNVHRPGDDAHPRYHWIAPCRKRLERLPEDAEPFANPETAS